MYIVEAEISNLRSIRKLSWSIAPEQAAGWHVILGDNGSGKSSVLRALALALAGHENAQALRQSWETWIRKGETQVEVYLRLLRDEQCDRPVKGKRLGKKTPLTISFFIEKTEGSQSPVTLSTDVSFLRGSGWFSAAYGPFRRFSGGDKEYATLFESNPRLARYLSIFDESVALTECLDWLRQLRFRELEGSAADKVLLERLREFINQEDFLPFGARLHEISSKQVTFLDGNGCEVRIEDLSDGYRSILSMTFELIRQLASEFDPESLFAPNDPTCIVIPGVVLIDEIDVHLHPTWQRRVGLWFRQHFPKMQFIVTTHSPLVCQAAEVGTVFRLPQPGGPEEPAMVAGQDLDRLLYGNILDAYGTGIFGRGITRSAASRQRLDRLAQLNVKEISEGLSEQEAEEQSSLRAALPTAAHTLRTSDAADR